MQRMNTRSAQRALRSIVNPGGEINGMEREPCMRVGIEFQAPIPELQQSGNPPSEGTGAVLVWAPCSALRDEDLEAYLQVSKEQFGYGIEQAHGLLYWHKYNIEKAVEDLPNFCPLQDDWTMEDKVTFEQAFQYHGKNFQRIRAMGIFLSTTHLTSMAEDSDLLRLQQLDREITELKEHVQENKQALMELCDSSTVEALRPSTFTRKGGLPATRWAEDEIQLALEVIREHGKDYSALSTALQNKSIGQCRNFFTNYKRKLNLPRIIADYEVRTGQKFSRYSKPARESLQYDDQVVGAGQYYDSGDLLDLAHRAKRPHVDNGSAAGEGLVM